MTGYGPHTQIDLSDLSFLTQLSAQAPDREAARFALELSALSYDFRVDPWLAAGWTDISIQADERLMGGVAAPDAANRPLYQRVLNQWVPVAARRHISSNRVIRQVAGRVWKARPAQTGKAVTMIHPLPDGRYAVAIGFMGTGKRRMDWEVNFHFAHPEGFHAGFLSVAQQFEDNCDKIHFDQVAAQLGLSQLTLADILAEARRPDSRFTLFAAGHSQGAAVLQLWLWRQVQAGLLPRHIQGYGFAAPSVAAESLPAYRDLPLTLVLNSDDAFARMGLRAHLGRAWQIQSDDALRAFCYQGHETDPVFMRLLHRYNALSGTRDALLFSIGYLQAMARMPQEDARASLGVLLGGGLTERVLLWRDEPVGNLLRLMNRLLRSNYRNATGGKPDEGRVTALADALLAEALEAGAERYTRTLFQALGAPHTLVFRDRDLPGLAPYTYIVVREYARLTPMNPEEPTP